MGKFIEPCCAWRVKHLSHRRGLSWRAISILTRLPHETVARIVRNVRSPQGAPRPISKPPEGARCCDPKRAKGFKCGGKECYVSPAKGRRSTGTADYGRPALFLWIVRESATIPCPACVARARVRAVWRHLRLTLAAPVANTPLLLSMGC